jgi:putative ABC transport system permease protein
MRAIDRKLLRDLWGMRGQSLAIAMVMACGIATFVMSLSVLESLKVSRSVYYNQSRFAHVFTSLKRAPLSLRQRIAEIPGVLAVQTRVVAAVTLDVPGMDEPAVGRLISVPDMRPPEMNRLYLRSGRYIEPGRRGEVLVGEAFATAHKLEPGDSVRAVINGSLEELRIVGVALAPEYLFQIKPGDLLPDPKRFGVFWMGEDQLGPAYDMDGAFNDVALRLMRGASEEQVLLQLDQLTEAYGGVGAHGRDRQLSARYLDDEIKQLRGMGLLVPAIFLSVSAFLLNVVTGRLIGTQREQIAALKAFGYSRWQVGWHYLKLILLITFVGASLGTAAGAWLGKGMTGMYAEFYHFPVFYFEFDLRIVMFALAIGCGAAVLGTMGAVRRAALLPPAEAMRPEPPARFRPTFVERMGLGPFLAQTTRMILRQLERRPLKSLLSATGIAFAVAILVLGRFMLDALDYLIEFQFFRTQRYDVTVTLVEPASPDVKYELAHLPGVLRCETFRAVPVRLRYRHRSRDLAVMGLDDERVLQRLIDADGKPVSLPPEGLLLSDKLAEILGVEPGGSVTVEVLEGKRPVLSVPVGGVIRDFAGMNAYMDVDALHRLLQEGQVVSGGYLLVDADQIENLYTELKLTPQAAGVTVRQAAVQNFEDTVAENQLRMQGFNILFACIIAFGVVYNTARISLAERSHELATMRVLGFTRREVSAILLGELAVLTLLAIPLGLTIGYLFAAGIVYGVESELYRFPLVITPRTYGFAAGVTVIASLISGLIVRRRIDRLDLIAVLKSKE